jgi:5'-methylthioadenosine phosphorylase
MNGRGVDVGVFGGSGFYSLLEGTENVKVDTPYGPPSDAFTIGKIEGKRVAFLARHGRDHSIPPHKINYRANVWAMKSLGAKVIISPCACGSLQKEIEPGHFVLCDQFVDRTRKREDTFYDGPIVSHVSSADLYSQGLRDLALAACKKCNVKVHEAGTIVVIQGPRFSTKAESQWFTSMGWSVIGMTQYPEAYLCRELGMSVVNISLVTDYDSGLVANVEAVNAASVLEVFRENSVKIREVVGSLIRLLPDDLGEFDGTEGLEHTRGDAHVISEEDFRQIHLWETRF